MCTQGPSHVSAVDDTLRVPRMFVPVDAITQPTGRIELTDCADLSDRLELADTHLAMPEASDRHHRKLVVAGAVAAAAIATAIFLLSPTAGARTAAPQVAGAHDEHTAELAQRRAAVVVLGALPVRSPDVQLTIGEHRAAIGMLLAGQGELDDAVVELTSVLVMFDRVALADHCAPRVALVRARTDLALATIAMQRGQHARASIYLRSGIALTDQLASDTPENRAARELGRDLRALLARL